VRLLMNIRIVFWDVLPCKIIVDQRFRGTCCLHHQELHTRRRENLKSHMLMNRFKIC
jgi:hypothetical protein